MKNNEFTDIINAIKHLESVKPDEQFRSRMQKKVSGLAPTGRFTMPLFALRVALVVFLVLLGGTDMVRMASTSQPGQALYPIRQIVDSVKTTFTVDKQIAKAPTPIVQAPTPTPTISQQSPTPTPFVETKKQVLPATDINTNVTLPTQTPTPTATSQPQGVVPAVQSTVNTVVKSVPVNIQIGTSNPTPTPQSQTEGSKDNGTSAGAGGSLLPKIKIKL